MTKPNLYLFDDAQAREWLPFALTRPAGELLFGTSTLRARAERALGLRCAGYLAAEQLAGFREEDTPPVISAVPGDGARMFLNARVVLEPFTWRAPAGPTRFVVDGRTAGWLVPAGSDAPAPGVLFDGASAPAHGDVAELTGTWLDHLWDLVAGNAERIAADLAGQAAGAALPAHVSVLGDAGAIHAGSVEFEPHVVLDARTGPIRIEDGVVIRAGTRLAGPSWIGRNTTLLGGSISAVSIGPHCKVRGEVEESVILGFSNKAHDGFLGHAYLGRWVNLGALTTNSDLKNNYGTIRIQTARGMVDTGLMKLGCLLGDHVKTGIGVMLNTGTVIGAGSNVFGAAPPKYVPPFSWCDGHDLKAYELEKFLDTARTVMARRGIELGDDVRSMLTRAWHAARGTK